MQCTEQGKIDKGQGRQGGDSHVVFAALRKGNYWNVACVTAHHQ